MTLLGAPTDHERKRLGQYFTGPTLSRLLASLADSASAARVIDPMAESGDLVLRRAEQPVGVVAQAEDRRAERAASSARSAGGPGFLHGIT